MRITNKPLYATVFMAINLAHAAPASIPIDTNDNSGLRVVDSIPSHQAHVQVGHQGIHVTAPMENDAQPSDNQVKLVVDGVNDETHLHGNHRNHSKHNDEKTHRSRYVENAMDALEDQDCVDASVELAKDVVSLRDYIDTLSEEEYDTFLNCYFDDANEDDLFALELALELEEDEQGNLLEPVFECSPDAIEYVPYKKHSHHYHQSERSDHHRHHLGSNVECTELEVEEGLCGPLAAYREGTFHREIEEDLACTKAEMEEGKCDPIEEHRRTRQHHHHHHHNHHKSQQHLREGEEVNVTVDDNHRGYPIRLTHADGFLHEENTTLPHIRHSHHRDEDLLSHNGALQHSPKLQVEEISSPLGFMFNVTPPLPVKREDASEEKMAKRDSLQHSQASSESPVSSPSASPSRGASPS